MALVRGAVLKHYQRRVEDLVVANLSRLASMSDGKKSVQMPGVDCNAIAVTRQGAIYFAESKSHQVIYVHPGIPLKGTLRRAHKGRPRVVSRRMRFFCHLTSRCFMPANPRKMGMVVPSASRMHACQRGTLLSYGDTRRIVG